MKNERSVDTMKKFTCSNAIKVETEILRSASLYFRQIVTIAKQYNHNKFVPIEKELLKVN